MIGLPPRRPACRSFPGRGVAVVLTLLCACALGACRKPPELNPHLRRGLELASADPARALAEFEQVPGDGSPLKAYGVGVANEALGRYEPAAAAYERAVAGRPDAVAARTALARVRILRGDPSRGRAELTAVVRDAPGHLPAVLLLAILAADEPQLVEALGPLRDWPSRRDAETAQRPLPAEYLLTLAELEGAARNVGASRTALEQARGAELAAPPGALALARLGRALGQDGLARSLAQKLAASSLDAALARDVAELALELELAPAAKLATAQLPLFPADPRHLLLLGRYELLVGNRHQGIEALKKSVALLAASPSELRDRAESELGRALLEDGKAKEAEALVSRLVARSPAFVPGQLLLARVERQAGRTRAALERLGRLHRQHPDDTTVLEYVGAIAIGVGDHPGAEAAYRRLAKLAPRSPRAAELLAHALALQGKHGEAARVLEAAADRMPGEHRLVKALADGHVAQQQPDQAVAALVRRVKRAPDDVELALLLAATYERLGRKVELRATLEDLTRRVPTSAAAWIALGRLEEVSENPAGTVAALERAIAAEPSATEARLRLAAHWDRQGEARRAAAVYEAILEQDGAQVAALNNAAVLYADRLGDAPRAVELAEKALKLAPDAPTVEDTLGWALVRRGRPGDVQRALPLLERASLGLEHPDVKLHLAVARHLSGRAEEARPLVKGFRYLPQDPGHEFARAALAKPAPRGAAEPRRPGSATPAAASAPPPVASASPR